MSATTVPLLVPPKEARALLRIGNTKLYDLVRNGELDLVKIGRASRITLTSIRKLAEVRHGA